MKKLIALLLAAVMLLSLAACSSTEEKPAAPTEAKSAEAPAEAPTEAPTEAPAEAPADAGELVIYTAADQTCLDVYVAGFEAATGVKVEIVSAGTGELLKRIVAEAENPLGDIEFGGTVSVVLPYKDYFEPYVSVNNDAMIESCKNVEGCITPYNVLPICMVVNTNLIGDLEINGYEDLLNPELKGQIAFVDPAQSSTGLQHVTTILQAMGYGDEEKGWEYMSQLIENLDGKLLSGSSAVGKGVADGEYIVGCTHEGYVSSLLRDGYPVKPVYQEEGLLVSAGTAQIIKGAKNLENAKKFIDYITSYDCQVAAGEKINERGTRADIPAPAGLPAITEMNVMVEDVYNTMEKSQSFLERFKDIYTG